MMRWGKREEGSREERRVKKTITARGGTALRRGALSSLSLGDIALCHCATWPLRFARPYNCITLTPGMNLRDNTTPGMIFRDNTPPGMNFRDITPPGTKFRSNTPSGMNHRDNTPSGMNFRDIKPPGTNFRAISHPLGRVS